MSVTSRGILRGYLSRFQSTDQLTSQGEKLVCSSHTSWHWVAQFSSEHLGHGFVVVSVQRLTHLATAQVVGSFWIDYKIATVETFREPYLVPPSGEHVVRLTSLLLLTMTSVQSSTWFCLSNVFSFAMREIMATVVWGGNGEWLILECIFVLLHFL